MSGSQAERHPLIANASEFDAALWLYMKNSWNYQKSSTGVARPLKPEVMNLLLSTDLSEIVDGLGRLERAARHRSAGGHELERAHHLGVIAGFQLGLELTAMRDHAEDRAALYAVVRDFVATYGRDNSVTIVPGRFHEGGAALTGYDMESFLFDSLHPGWLNDAALNASLRMQTANNAQIRVMESVAWTAWRDAGGSLPQVPHAPPGAAPVDVPHLYIPIHHGAHWAAVHVNPTERTIQYLDSIRDEARQRATVEQVREFLRQSPTYAHLPQQWTLLPDMGEQQRNASDCGVFVIAHLRTIIDGYGRPVISPSNTVLNTMRVRLDTARHLALLAQRNHRVSTATSAPAAPGSAQQARSASEASVVLLEAQSTQPPEKPKSGPPRRL